MFDTVRRVVGSATGVHEVQVEGVAVVTERVRKRVQRGAQLGIAVLAQRRRLWQRPARSERARIGVGWPVSGTSNRNGSWKGPRQRVSDRALADWPTMSDAAAIEVRGLAKAYGPLHAVDRIDLRVEHGQCVALLGPNGAGKTTATEILEGYRHRDAGEVAVLGVDPGRADRRWRTRIGIVLQRSTTSGT